MADLGFRFHLPITTGLNTLPVYLVATHQIALKAICLVNKGPFIMSAGGNIAAVFLLR